MPDKDGPYANPLYLFTSRHSTTIGVRTLSRKTKEFLEKERAKSGIDILSVSAGIDEDRLMVVALVRVYGKKPKFADLSGFLGEKREDDNGKEKGPRLLIRGIQKDNRGGAKKAQGGGTSADTSAGKGR